MEGVTAAVALTVVLENWITITLLLHYYNTRGEIKARDPGAKRGALI